MILHYINSVRKHSNRWKAIFEKNFFRYWSSDYCSIFEWNAFSLFAANCLNTKRHWHHGWDININYYCMSQCPTKTENVACAILCPSIQSNDMVVHILVRWRNSKIIRISKRLAKVWVKILAIGQIGSPTLWWWTRRRMDVRHGFLLQWKCLYRARSLPQPYLRDRLDTVLNPLWEESE